MFPPFKVFQQGPQQSALRMPDDQPGSGFIAEREEIEFLPQFTMIALAGFFESGKIGLQGLFVLV